MAKFNSDICQKCGEYDYECICKPIDLAAERASGSMERMVRRFRDLPLGTRFKYLGGADVWVVLERHGFGLIAKWEGVDGPTWGQSICSLTETEAECEKLEVIVAESSNRD